MEKILHELQKHHKLHNKLRAIYGKTIGLWWLKDLYIRHIGFYNGKKRLKLMSDIEAEEMISRMIKSKKPFALGRYGSTEFRTIFSKDHLSTLCFNSGFFPDEEKLWSKFRKVYFDATKDLNILAVWNYRNHFINKTKLLRKYDNIEYIIPLSVIGGIHFSWLDELRGKKVLVVHPFKKTIEEQYKKYDKLGILPKFKSLDVIRAVQTLGDVSDERFDTWFDALDYMKKEIDKKDFDIALIGCGAYGLPLVAHVKSLGKQAIHMGGGLQLLFGIKGKRWNDKKKVKYNKYWVSPYKEDFIKGYKRFEGGSYW